MSSEYNSNIHQAETKAKYEDHVPKLKGYMSANLLSFPLDLLASY